METLDKLGRSIQSQYQEESRVLSFGEYLEVLKGNPLRHLRNSAQYLRDMFDHFGSEMVRYPGGEIRRFSIFDAPWDNGQGRLVGQERVQNAIYRLLKNFVRQRRVNKFILLHGPNGSSKSTVTEMLSRGLESYSALDEGALYRFNWIFPTKQPGRSGIGFGSQEDSGSPGASYAHLDEADVDARLLCELHDHPLLLVPRQTRKELVEELAPGEGEDPDGGHVLSDYILNGDLCPKCKQVYEALLNSYKGDYQRVLRHVQVERFYVSRRYRQASTRVEPQFAVDAQTQQITADRSLTSLPTALQSTNLFEAAGDLVEANRGVIDYADLLKRPLDAYKYLLATVEEGRVSLDRANLYFDMIFVGSSNDLHLGAFMQSPEWTSFKARIELVRVPYLLDHVEERRIYDEQLQASQVHKHIAPHATGVAALWAVLTRMRRPEVQSYEDALKKLVNQLKPLEKAELYSSGQLPEGVKGEDAKLLSRNIAALYEETEADSSYEGGFGASPREVKTVILNAAHDSSYGCLSPEAVLQELRSLVRETAIYDYLRVKPKDGYYDNAAFIDMARVWYLDRVDEDLWAATGLVEEASHGELFSRYINCVTHFVRKEKMLNEVTGDYEDPDIRFMTELEQELGASEGAEDFRQGLISKIGAWSIDNTGEKPDYALIFPDHLERLRSSYYARQRVHLAEIIRHVLQVLDVEASGLSAGDRAAAEDVVKQLKTQYHYCDTCSREAITNLYRERYADQK